VARNTEQMPDFKDVKKEMKFLMKKLDIFEQEKYEQEKQSCLEDG